MLETDLGAAFKTAARALRESRVNASLLRGAANDIDAGGVLLGVLDELMDRAQRAGRLLVPADIPARFAATMHALALGGQSDLARLYPSTGGHGNLHETWPVAREVLERERAETVARMLLPSRRSMPARGVLLQAALAHLGARGGERPFRVFDIGAGPGFALATGHFRQDFFGEVIGPADSAVDLGNIWAVAPELDLSSAPAVVDAAGCESMPLDLSSSGDVNELLAWAGPDVPADLQQIRSACEVTARAGLRIEPIPASSWLPRVISWPRTDAASVVWHSDLVLETTMRERTELATEILAAAERATEAAPLHVVSFEPVGAEHVLYADPVGGSVRRGEVRIDPLQFELRVSSWPEGVSERLAVADPRGRDAHWVAAGSS